MKLLPTASTADSLSERTVSIYFACYHVIRLVMRVRLCKLLPSVRMKNIPMILVMGCSGFYKLECLVILLKYVMKLAV